MDESNTYEAAEEKVEHTLSETDKKCPDCGGTMDFDPKTGALLCPYCGNIVEIEDDETAPERAQELAFDEAEITGNCDWGTEKRVIHCKSCGAETIYDASTVSGECREPFSWMAEEKAVLSERGEKKRKGGQNARDLFAVLDI